MEIESDTFYVRSLWRRLELRRRADGVPGLAQRFRGFFDDAAEGVAKVGEQLTDATNKLADWIAKR